MSQPGRIFKVSAIPNTTLRRLRVLPSYFFLVWRWSMWLYAFCVIGWSLLPQNRPYILYNGNVISYQYISVLLLSITFIETLIVTLYAPVIQILLPLLFRSETALSRGKTRQQRQQAIKEDLESELLPPLARTRNQYWDITIYTMDVIICGLVTYYSGPFSNPPFGLGSPFYRYGMSAVFAAAFVYRYRGGLLAAIGYDIFSLLGLFFPAPGAHPYTPHTLVDIGGSLVDTPLIAIIVAYLATLLDNYAQSKRNEQENARTQKYLARVSETLLKNTGDREELLRHSIATIQKAWHFQRMIIALIEDPAEENDQHSYQISFIVEHIAHDEVFPPDQGKMFIEEVMQSGKKLQTFERFSADPHCTIARLYIPLYRDGKAQLILGAESKRSTPFAPKHENFLTIAGVQLLVALDNIRLAEQTIQLAAAAERTRIAREIHDGIAQLTYMLSLQAETCQAQALRLAEASEEDAELITPLAERIGKLVTISKQALWETRNYMFSLKPLMSGTTTLTQMLDNQLKEFEAISDITTHLEVKGTEQDLGKERRQSKRTAQIGAALFRIVQEALTNSYKHAEATTIKVQLCYNPDSIELVVADNGRGLPLTGVTAEEQHILSGHGLGGMRERASELGGTLSVATGATGGVVVHACIPL